MRLGHLIEEDGITYLVRSEPIDPDNVMAEKRINLGQLASDGSALGSRHS
jgi:hypothetical protein